MGLHCVQNYGTEFSLYYTIFPFFVFLQIVHFPCIFQKLLQICKCENTKNRENAENAENMGNAKIFRKLGRKIAKFSEIAEIAKIAKNAENAKILKYFLINRLFAQRLVKHTAARERRRKDMLTPKALKPLLLLVVALYGSFLLLVYVDGLQYVRATSSQASTHTQIPTTLPLGIRLQHSRAPPLRIEQMDPPLYLQAEGILINYFIILLFFIALLLYCFIVLLFSYYFLIIF